MYEAVAGIVDKKTHGLLLLSLAFNIIILLKIGKVADLLPISIPSMLIKPPNVASFESKYSDRLKETFDIAWLLMFMSV